MSDKDDKNKIISFPGDKTRKDIKRDKKTKLQHAEDKLRNRKDLEDQYRAQYRAREAQGQARKSSHKNNSFINWDKIPFFTRVITGLIIAIHIAVSIFAYEFADKNWLIYTFGFAPGAFTDAAEWKINAILTPITSIFLHDGWTHLIFNTVMLLAMGVFFEREFGAKRSAIVFLTCGVLGNFAYLLINPFSTVPVIGASGAISGLFAVAFMMMIERGMMGPEMQKKGPLPFLLLWSTVIIVFGLMSSDVSWQSHLGGFLSGAGFYHLWKKGTIRF